MDRIKILELFGGIGAPRKAMENLGINHKAIDYVEIDEKAVRTYNSLFINKYSPESVIGYNLKPDILIHGSPCQDFCRAGKRLGGNDEDKTRSSLMFETLRIIQNFGTWKPGVVVWENVKAVLDKDIKHSFKKYLDIMTELGYRNNYEILNAMDFGIPQKRERIFVVSTLKDKKFDFNQLKRTEARHIKDFLEENVDDRYNVTQPSMIKKLPENLKKGNFKGYLQIIEDYAWTVTTKQVRNPNSGVINIGNGRYRYLTERECWRLMGFSDNDFDNASKANPTRPGCMNGNLYKQAGNSIVIPVLESIFSEIIENYI